MVIYDGQKYESEADIPDFGSIELVGIDGGKREYRAKREDFSKLPTYDNLPTGSSCLFVDTGDYAEYKAKDKTWYLL